MPHNTPDRFKGLPAESAGSLAFCGSLLLYVSIGWLMSANRPVGACKCGYNSWSLELISVERVDADADSSSDDTGENPEVGRWQPTDASFRLDDDDDCALNATADGGLGCLRIGGTP